MPGELKLRNRAEKSMIFRILRGFCGERGSRTYMFKKYHKIANY